MNNGQQFAVTRRTLIGGLSASVFVLLLPGGLRASSRIIQIRDLYNHDLSFSNLAKSLKNTMVEITGFMAPPLKAESHFFVLTQRPMAVCPFCESEADWPDDIIAVHSKRIAKATPFNVLIVTRGRLKLGSFTDPDTGFVSQARVVDAAYRRKD